VQIHRGIVMRKNGSRVLRGPSLDRWQAKSLGQSRILTENGYGL
jgi:hypothetical protein